MTVKILHLSDIHLDPSSEGEGDPDAIYRDALVEVVRQSATDAPFDCIFVTGDIAARGAAHEYVVAKAWLDRLASVARCSTGSIFVVPGNHDVDRVVTRTNETLKLVQSAIVKAKDEAEREATLKRMLADANTGPTLFRHLENYNDFATEYQCEIGPTEHGRWIRHLPLGHGYRLKIFGLNSVLCSSCLPPGEDDQRAANLYVGPFQATFRRQPEDVTVALIHHPPDWLLDGDLHNRALNNNVVFHFLGHKHDRDVQITADYVRFGAGAVNPSRHELGFQPGFNIITLDVHRDDSERFELQMSAEVWVWQENPGQFIRHKTRKQQELWETRIELPVIPAEAEPMAVDDRMPAPAKEAIGFGAPVQRFWDLSSRAKSRIAESLDLLSEDERRLPERYRYSNIFGRAVEKGKLDELLEAIRTAGDFA